jgi:hypothetical protein
VKSEVWCRDVEWRCREGPEGSERVDERDLGWLFTILYSRPIQGLGGWVNEEGVGQKSGAVFFFPLLFDLYNF